MVSNTNVIKIELRRCFVPQVNFPLKYVSRIVQSVIHLCYYNQMANSSHLVIFKEILKAIQEGKKMIFFFSYPQLMIRVTLEVVASKWWVTQALVSDLSP